MFKSKCISLLLILSFALTSCSAPRGNPRSEIPIAIETKIGTRDSASDIEKQVNFLLKKLTLEEKISLLHANSKFSVAGVERLNIPEMKLSDGPHGVRAETQRDQWEPSNSVTDYATYLPPLTAVAASWDPEIATLHGDVLGSEARHRGKDVILGPGVNLARLPLNGRNFEYMTEDPFLASRTVVPEIKAIQKHDVAACVKHYALNSQELERFTVNAQPDERTLREVYLQAFEAAVREGGSWSIMGSYNQVNGTNSNQNRMLANDILKSEWGFKGVLLTDWNVNINSYDAAMNGLDLEMGTEVSSYDDYFFAKPLLELVRNGKVPESIIDEKIRRILRMEISIGMLDKSRQTGERNTSEHREAAKKIAESSIVLLKNTHKVLPLNKSSLKRILVMGPNTNMKHGRSGGSSKVKSEYEITPLQGLKNALGKDVEIVYLRVADKTKVQPIAPDYLEMQTRSASPAWTIAHYDSAARSGTPVIAPSTVAGPSGSLPSSSYTSPNPKQMQYITLSANLVPIVSGIHQLQLQIAGSAQVLVDGKVAMTVKDAHGKIFTHNLTLEGGKAYAVEIRYDGHQYFTLGWDAPGSRYASKEEYMAAARDADAVLYFGGLNHDLDREGEDRANMQLPGGQDPTIANLAKANPNTVVFLIAGSAVEMPWISKINTVVWGWYGGMEGGNAFARMLLGDINPSGKMPITLPVKLADTAAIALNDYNDKNVFYKEGVFIGYRWFEQQNIKPLFPFGHGESYTTFEISNLQMPNIFDAKSAEFPISVTVKNSGTRAGAEVVQLYLGDRVASVKRPAKELKGFKKVFLEAGESKTVTINLTRRDLSFWDVNTKNWLAEPGEFDVYIGASIADIRARGVFDYR